MSKKPEPKKVENVQCFDHMPMNLRPQQKPVQPANQSSNVGNSKKP